MLYNHFLLQLTQSEQTVYFFFFFFFFFFEREHGKKNGVILT